VEAECRERGRRIATLTESVCVIVNPISGGGRAAEMLPKIRSAFNARGVRDFRITSGSHRESDVAREAIAEGATTIIVAGGDGTTANVANAILDAGGDTRLGVVPVGTGNDFAKTIQPGRPNLDSIARRATEWSDTRVDVGRVEGTYFLNSCGFGFDVAVVQGLAHSRWLRGNAIYIGSALGQLFAFRGVEIGVESASLRRERTLHMMIVFANAPYFGGAFHIAPIATVTDGQLDAVMFADASPLRRLMLLGAVTRGTHARFREVSFERSPTFVLHFDEAPWFESDGELHRALSSDVTVECVPRALRVLIGDGVSP
jgi:diacylglycerol kinase (ATP)